MKKIFNKFLKLFLTFILLFTDIAPIINVFADMNANLSVEASTSLDGQYTKIQNNTIYTFDQSTSIDNYYFKLNGSDFEESENYLIKTNINFYGEWDEESIYKTKNLISFKKGTSLNNGVFTSMPYDYIVPLNGTYDVNLSIYKVSDIVLNGENLNTKTEIELESLKETLEITDLSNYTKVTNNSFKIKVTNLSSGLVISNVSYENGENIIKENDIYKVDNNIDKNIIIKLHHDIASLNPNETYHFNIYLNDCFVETYSNLDTSTLSGDITINIGYLINGNYTIEFRLYDSKDNIIESNTILLNSINSIITDLNSYFTLDEDTKTDISKLKTKIINYKALSEEDKNTLDTNIKVLLESYLDKINNLILDEYLNINRYGLNADSYYYIKNNEISIIYGLDGTFVKEVLVSNQVLVSEFKEKFPNINITIYQKDGKLASDDKYLETGMKVIANYSSIINEYILVVRGNIVSEDGLISIEDIREMISLGIDISNLSSEYYFASDVNNDNKVNVLDTTKSYYILNNEDNIDTFNDYQVPTYQTENKILASIESDKTNLRVGDTFKISLKVEGLTQNAINGLQGILTFNNNLIKCKSVAISNNWIGNINVINENNYGKFMYLGNSILEDGNLIVFTFETLKEGSVNIKVTDLIMALNGAIKELENDETNSILVNIDRALGNDARIKELKIDKGILNQTFNKDITDYILYVDYFEETINIDGILEDINASTTGFKEYALNNYKTIIPITVIAEDGNTKIYTINVIKVDRRSNNTNLKELTIEGVIINFEKDKLEYEFTVDYEVDKLDINAIAEHFKSIVLIKGDTNLKVGKNQITITVKSEKGDTKDYILNVIRKSEEKESIIDYNETKGKNSRLLLIVLIIATICLLLYIIFKDDDSKKIEYTLKEKDNKKENNKNKKEDNKKDNNNNNKRKNKK